MENLLDKNQTLKVVFKNPEGLEKELSISVQKLIDSSEDDLYDLLENSEPCTCSPNESRNFCECEPQYEDFTFSHLSILT